MRERAVTADFAAEFIDRFDLDLNGLTVLTEAASGPYLSTPLTSALAGADRVLALTAGSEYGTAEDVAEATERLAGEWGVGDRVEVGHERRDDWFGAADVVTNSGFVRPIDARAVAAMKPTAVVPLMWETWEFRDADVDLTACRERGILVLGTREDRPPCDMRPYSGQLAIQLLAELGINQPGSKVLLLGGHATYGVPIEQALSDRGDEVTWFSGEDGARPYEEAAGHCARHAREYDALILAEHEDPTLLLGPAGVGLLDPAGLAEANPDLRVGVITGNVDADALRASGLHHLPERIRRFGYESYETHRLGARPVLELYAAGLKVGQEMARARLRGDGLADAARHALAASPAMDFTGDRAWVS